jgi:hypothetical protein
MPMVVSMALYPSPPPSRVFLKMNNHVAEMGFFHKNDSMHSKRENNTKETTRKQ